MRWLGYPQNFSSLRRISLLKPLGAFGCGVSAQHRLAVHCDDSGDTQSALSVRGMECGKDSLHLREVAISDGMCRGCEYSPVGFACGALISSLCSSAVAAARAKFLRSSRVP